MPKFVDKLVARIELWAIKGSEVARFDGIGVASLRGEKDWFAQTINSSLRLIRERDSRRYARVKKHVAWIVNAVTNTMGAEYQFDNRVCYFQSDEMPDVPWDQVVALHACMLVHEATHGLIGSRGIRTTIENRVRIERLYTEEQSRFAARLAAYDRVRYPPELLDFPFDEGLWEVEWEAGRAKKFVSFISRWLADRKSR